MKSVGILLCCLVCRVCSEQLFEENDVVRDTCQSGDIEMTASKAEPTSSCPGIEIFGEWSRIPKCIPSEEMPVTFYCYYNENCGQTIEWLVDGEIVKNDNDMAKVNDTEKASYLTITGLTGKPNGNHTIMCFTCVGKTSINDIISVNVCIKDRYITTKTTIETTLETPQITTLAREQTKSDLGVIVGVSVTCSAALVAIAVVLMLFYSKAQRRARKSNNHQLQALHIDVTCNEYVDSTMVMTTAAVVGSSVAMSANLAHNIYQEVDNIRSPRNNEVTGSENHVTDIDLSDGPHRSDIDRLYAKPNKGNKQERRYGGEASNGEVDSDPSQLYAKPNKLKKNLPKEGASSDQISGDGVDHLYAKPDKKNKRRHEERSHELHDAV